MNSLDSINLPVNNTTIVTICLASIATVLMENFLEQLLNNSSNELPSNSITKQLYKDSWPK